MQEFRDNEGRAWSITLNFAGVERVRDALRINLLDPLGAGRRPANGKPRKRRFPLLTRLQLDPALLMNVVFLLIKPQADKREVDDQAFAEAMGGDESYGAYVAFMEEYRRFFLGLRRTPEARAIEANAEMVKRETEKNLQLIDQATAAAEAATDRRRERAREILERIARGPSPTSTASPGSSALTPDP